MPTPRRDDRGSYDKIVLQTAIRCYLGTILAVADCMAAICPGIGIAYQKRLRRIPKRIGFDVSVGNLEASREVVEGDLKRFGELTGKYVGYAVPVLEEVVTTGGDVADTILERAAAQVVLLETLADQIEAAVDLGDAEEMREALEHQPAGLRRCAEQLQRDLLPLMGKFRTMLRNCETTLDQTRRAVTVDATTGFLHAEGFEEELDSRIAAKNCRCLVALLFEAKFPDVVDSSDEVFGLLVDQIGRRIAEQFRAIDVLGRLGPLRFGVIFDGKVDVARVRAPQIAASLSDRYSVNGMGVDVTAVTRVIEVHEIDEVEDVLSRIDEAVADYQVVVPTETEASEPQSV